MPDNWYNSYSKIKVFGKILYQADVLEDVDDVFDYFNKPSTYDDAFKLWEELGSPESGEKGWNDFKDNIVVQVIESDGEEDDTN